MALELRPILTFLLEACPSALGGGGGGAVLGCVLGLSGCSSSEPVEEEKRGKKANTKKGGLVLAGCKCCAVM